MYKEKSIKMNFVRYRILQISQKRLSFKLQRAKLPTKSNMIVDCIANVIVDSGDKIVVKWECSKW